MKSFFIVLVSFAAFGYGSVTDSPVNVWCDDKCTNITQTQTRDYCMHSYCDSPGQFAKKYNLN